MNPAKRQQDCYLLSAIIDLSEPKDLIFGEIIVQVSFFCQKTHRKGGKNTLMHFTTGKNTDFSASWPNILDWVPLLHQKMKYSDFHTAAVFFHLTPICWSMHFVIMLGSFSCSSSHYSIHIHFWTFSIIAWINCMNKVSISCLNLFLGFPLAAFLQCSSHVGTRWNFSL